MDALYRHLSTSTAIKRIDERTRTIEHVISSKAVDRDGEVLLPKGCKFDTYLQMNPVVFFNHNQRELPIAKCAGIEVTQDAVLATTQFAGMDQMHERAETIFLLYRDGFLKSWSVGLQPKVISRDAVAQGQTGRTIVEWELLEYSGVGIPSNPEAVVRFCKAAGLPAGASEVDLMKAAGAIELQKWWTFMTPAVEKRELSARDFREAFDEVLFEVKLEVAIDQAASKIARLTGGRA